MENLLHVASSSLGSNLQAEDGELTQLTQQGISVWGENHHKLELQALTEIDIFAKEIRNGTRVQKSNNNELDINSYIKRQEELRKIQEHKKTLIVDSKSKIIADKISNKYKKRKMRDTDERAVKKSVASGKHFIVKHNLIPPNKECLSSSESEYVPSDDEESESDFELANLSSKKKKECPLPKFKDKIMDDGHIDYFKGRLEQYYKYLEEQHSQNVDDVPEFYTIKGGLKIPMRIWSNLYPYQQESVRWLWNLHRQAAGGILGDEMGLGKTVQLIVFLAGLECSQVISHDRFKGLGPTLIVCPATVMYQWVKHFHDWAPEFRVAILHQSGTYQGKKMHLIREIIKNKGILITNYVGALKYKQVLSQYDWHYLILDEGHKIRNPNAKVTLAVKKIKTPHKLMLTGSPMQNNLQELWSLFDFTNPGMLGTLNTFMEHINNPIVQGEFINSTPLQEATALSVAKTLKNLITPHLLRRTKAEVQNHISLPNKSEQILFCSLSDQQRDLYKGYLLSDHVESILGKNSKNWFLENQCRVNVLIAITALRKICNHPDIYLHEAEETENGDNYFGYYKRAGKMIVVSALLKIWKNQHHRALLFTQSRAMITILENFLTEQGYTFLKMDGGTPIHSRQALINKFNEDSSVDVFLLTTKVGGLGVNLTGADRVIIYDPDWNPATDTQARERAWRIGQNKEVTIYRLISAGTIEEKMYQRQVWKQLLSNKVLVDPKTHKFFKQSGLHDLFSLPKDNLNTDPETANIFRNSRVKIQEKIKAKQKNTVTFSEDKIEEMKQRAQRIAKNLAVSKSHLEERRETKLKQRESLKKLTPMELRKKNRDKLNVKEVYGSNTVDDCVSDLSFSKALEYSDDTANRYHKMKDDRVTTIKVVKKQKIKTKIDNSGTIDGEKVQGLIKTEIKKSRKTCQMTPATTHDDYVLGKLFSKKGVSGVLEHDLVVNNNVRTYGLKLQTEAQLMADKALEALRSSRAK